MNLAAAAVALVVLVDLATGEGPPILNGYLAAAPPQAYPPPPAPMYQVGYMPRGEYDELPERKDDKLEAKNEAQQGSYSSGYNDDYKASAVTTAKPGMFSSLTNSMSDAWKSFTKLGRSTRSIDSENQAGTRAKSASRSYDPYESLQGQGQSFVYFKVARDLICGQTGRF